jgi:hypothetical protein
LVLVSEARAANGSDLEAISAPGHPPAPQANDRSYPRRCRHRRPPTPSAGAVRQRVGSGEPYKPSVVRSYEQSLRSHILPDIGARRLSDIRRRDVNGNRKVLRNR